MEKKNLRGCIFSNADLKELTLPLIMEQILAISVGMVDAITVSGVGGTATSGVSLMDMINTLFINIFATMTIEGAVVSSQYPEQKRRDRAYQSVDQPPTIIGILSLGIMTLYILLRKGPLSPIYQGVAEGVMRNVRVYPVISTLSYPSLSVYNSRATLFRSTGSSKISMQTSTVMNMINVIGDPPFVFVFHWGMTGAALASLISRTTAYSIFLYRLCNRNLDLYIGTGFKINRRMTKQILGIGVPNGIENSISQLDRVLVVGIIVIFGTTRITVNAIANNLDGTGVLPGQAMSLAVITVVGHLVGAGNLDWAEYYAKKMMKFTCVVSDPCCIAVILIVPFTLWLYDLFPEALCMGAILVLTHNGCAILTWPYSFCLANVLRAANDVKFPMRMSTIPMILFHIGFSLLLATGLGLGAVGVRQAMTVDWVAWSAFFGWRFFSGRWKRFYRAM